MVLQDLQNAYKISEGLLDVLEKKKVTRKSDKGDRMKKMILDTGVKLWPNVTAREIARRLGVTHPAVGYHFGETLRDAVAEHAVETGNARVIAQLIVSKHKAARKLSPEARAKYIGSIV